MTKDAVSRVAKLISTFKEYIARTFSDTQAGADSLLRNEIAKSEADRIKRLVAAQTALDLKAVREPLNKSLC